MFYLKNEFPNFNHLRYKTIRSKSNKFKNQCCTRKFVTSSKIKSSRPPNASIRFLHFRSAIFFVVLLFYIRIEIYLIEKNWYKSYYAGQLHATNWQSCLWSGNCAWMNVTVFLNVHYQYESAWIFRLFIYVITIFCAI